MRWEQRCGFFNDPIAKRTERVVVVRQTGFTKPTAAMVSWFVRPSCGNPTMYSLGFGLAELFSQENHW